MKNKNRSKGNIDKAITVINNDMTKYNNKPKNSKDSHERTFMGIPTELFILINSLQTDKIFTITRKVKGVIKSIQSGLTPNETRYLLTVIGVSDGYSIPYDTMCSLTGMYDSHITEAKNGLKNKGFISLSEDGKQLSINYTFMYDLFDSKYAEKCTNLVHHKNSTGNPISQNSASLYPELVHDDIPNQDIDISQNSALEYTNPVHILEEKKSESKKTTKTPSNTHPQLDETSDSASAQLAGASAPAAPSVPVVGFSNQAFSGKIKDNIRREPTSKELSTLQKEFGNFSINDVKDAITILQKLSGDLSTVSTADNPMGLLIHLLRTNGNRFKAILETDRLDKERYNAEIAKYMEQLQRQNKQKTQEQSPKIVQDNFDDFIEETYGEQQA